ncbi:QsdR family transcriptional regulator [Nocardia sp. alder85J]|uniref:QsdR family transcriptional regulator n=1 Tax=Nocardia sp. alder85J TaxID=2862949 RepID=UPI001CD2CAB9|nr:QsdR family transcriptional regulator [Nocardia sp. alder85J]MCX4092653.1 QsdR family transcriptional regulator [Nocardia sp. alder85J]
MPSTPLQRQLAADADPRRPTALDALALARADFLAGRRIDLGSIATRLGISRVTLYRWVGTREQLIVEAIWWLTSRTLDAGWAELEDRPGPRVPALVGHLLHAIWDQPGSRRSIERDNAMYMNLLTMTVHGFQPRMLAYLRDKLADDIDTGRVRTTLPLDDLAYTVLRVAESFHYLPTISGEPADPDRAVRVLTAILGGPGD